MNDTHSTNNRAEGEGTLSYRAAVDDRTDRLAHVAEAAARVGGDVILLGAVAVGGVTLLRAVILLIV